MSLSPPQLQSRHLTSLHLEVDFAGMLTIGESGAGRRRIAYVTGGSFEGEALRGTVLPGGADWVVNRPDGAMVVDVRLPLLTHDGAHLLLMYQGVLKVAPEIMARFNRGGLLSDAEFTLRTQARFETGAPQYAWLNDKTVVGVGRQQASGPVYELFEIL